MHIIHESDRESNGRLQTYVLEMGNFAVEILEDFGPLCQNLSASSYIAVTMTTILYIIMLIVSYGSRLSSGLKTGKVQLKGDRCEHLPST